MPARTCKLGPGALDAELGSHQQCGTLIHGCKPMAGLGDPIPSNRFLARKALQCSLREARAADCVPIPPSRGSAAAHPRGGLLQLQQDDNAPVQQLEGSGNNICGLVLVVGWLGVGLGTPKSGMPSEVLICAPTHNLA